MLKKFLLVALLIAAVSAAGEVGLLCVLRGLGPVEWSGRNGTDPCTFTTPCQEQLPGIMCDIDNQHIISVSFPYGGLNGVMPAEIADLPSLTLLDLSNNRLRGALPDLSGLKNLESFNVDNTQITSGPIPSWICNANIHKFYMSKTSRTGALPECLSATAITHLSLAENQLTGAFFPTIMKMQDITFIDLSDNSFDVSSLPEDIFTKLNMEHIRLRSASLVGSIPAGISNMTKLDEFDISMNKITGEIPAEFVNATMIRLNLGSNQLTGSNAAVAHIKTCDVSFNCLNCDVSACGCSVKQCSDHYSPKASKSSVAWSVVLCVLSTVTFIAIVGGVAFKKSRKSTKQGYSPI